MTPFTSPTSATASNPTSTASGRTRKSLSYARYMTMGANANDWPPERARSRQTRGEDPPGRGEGREEEERVGCQVQDDGGERERLAHREVEFAADQEQAQRGR